MMYFRLPDIGEGLSEAEVVRIHVQNGDRVEEYESPFLELSTDKATIEISAPVTGVVGALHVEEGNVVKVHQRIATFYEMGEYSLVQHTTYVAVQNLKRLNARSMCSRDPIRGTDFEELQELFEDLVRFALPLQGRFLDRLSKPMVNELQGILYTMWSCVVQVRSFEPSGRDAPKRRESVVDFVRERLPELLRRGNDIIERSRKPRVFVASSRANIAYAESIRDKIGEDIRCTAWPHYEAFRNANSKITIDSIMHAPGRYDFAVFVIGNEQLKPGNTTNVTIRDLLVLTVGVFLTQLGPTRVRLVKASSVLDYLDELEIYRYDEDANIETEMEEACIQIRNAIYRGGPAQPA